MNSARERDLALLVLSLCPAAVVSTRVVDALLLSAGVVIVLGAMSLLLALVRRIGGPSPVPMEGSMPQGTGARSPWGALLLSSCLTAIYDLVLSAAAPAASSRLGIYVPLISVNLLIMGRLDTLGATHPPNTSATNPPNTSATHPPRHSAFGWIRVGAGFTGLLVAVALVREVLGAGSITLGSTIAVAPFFGDPARALGLGGGALICLGYAAGALRLARRRKGAGAEEEGR